MASDSKQQKELSRRELIRRATCAAFATAAVASTVRDLRLVNAAVADALPAPATDYKALVCIFMGGGSDCNNFLIPIEDTPTGYQQYAATRSVAAIPLTAFTPANTLNSLSNDGHTYGVHPACPELAGLFNSGKLAFVCNVGPLLYPITRAQLQKKSVPVPPQLFSHNDQVIQWQTSIPDRDSRTGWAGRLADLTYSMNNSNTVSMSISVAGVNTLEVGNLVNEYNISTSGPQGLSSSSTEVNNLNSALKNINNYSLTPASTTFPQTNLYEVAYAGATRRAVDNFSAMNSALLPTDERPVDQGGSAWIWTVPFPTSSLGKQLKMIARCIAGRKALGHQRQIYFVTVGGFDTHTAQFNGADTITGTHANLLADLSTCVNAFQAAITQLRSAGGVIQMGPDENVTGFTASDFGRTCVTNGGGTDHGWGSHHIVFGDQVIGQRTYGAFPTLVVNTGDDSGGSGRWIPKVSVDEYSATLAKWFGVPPSSLNLIFPNLGRFLNPDLGFMGLASPAPLPLAQGGVINVSGGAALKSKPVAATARPAIARPIMRQSE